MPDSGFAGCGVKFQPDPAAAESLPRSGMGGPNDCNGRAVPPRRRQCCRDRRQAHHILLALPAAIDDIAEVPVPGDDDAWGAISGNRRQNPLCVAGCAHVITNPADQKGTPSARLR
jgi:hypothetical protein